MIHNEQLKAPPIPIDDKPIEEVFVDGLPTHMEVTQAAEPGQYVVKITMNVQGSSPEAPLQDLALKNVCDAIAGKQHRLRIGLVSDAAARSQFERMDADGTIRPLAAGEGTW